MDFPRTRFERSRRKLLWPGRPDELTQGVEDSIAALAQKLESERRTTQELEIAQQVQSRLFPQIHPETRTLEYAGLCLPARRVGGDYFDFLDLGPT